MRMGFFLSLPTPFLPKNVPFMPLTLFSKQNVI